MTQDFSEVAQTIQAQWASAFGRADWPTLVALYATDVAFYGSTPTLHTNPAGVLSYFETLPAAFVAANYAKPQITPMGPDVFAASGTVIFTVQVEGQATQRPYRMSQAFRRTSAGWQIVLHHASPFPT